MLAAMLGDGELPDMSIAGMADDVELDASHQPPAICVSALTRQPPRRA
jgi:hypothetical protein